MKPDKYTNKQFFLDVGDGHSLYVQDWGNPKAMPILFLHGGPGSGTSDTHKQLFEPLTQRVIFFDQRGSGQSLPIGSLKNNTTQDLVEDIEAIAKKLKLNKFVITGGSWGSCLALAYSLKYPKRVEALVLRGIFTGSQKEIDFLDKGEFKSFYPDVWDRYVKTVPKEFKSSPGDYHIAKAFGQDESAAKKSIYAYSELEGSLIGLDDRHTPQDFNDFDPTSTKVEMHYLVNKCFMPDRFILDNASKIKAPTWLVQGRYDMVCPPFAAYELNQKLPNSQLTWAKAGHSGNDRSNFDAVKTILKQWSKR